MQPLPASSTEGPADAGPSVLLAAAVFPTPETEAPAEPPKSSIAGRGCGRGGGRRERNHTLSLPPGEGGIPGRAAAGAADGASTQLELFPLLEPLSKGIMEKTMPVLWNGEDLDIPTFKRRNAAVDNGKLVGE